MLVCVVILSENLNKWVSVYYVINASAVSSCQIFLDVKHLYMSPCQCLVVCFVLCVPVVRIIFVKYRER